MADERATQILKKKVVKADDPCRLDPKCPLFKLEHLQGDDDLDYLADNVFIHSGYRVRYTWSQCFWSLFSMHNETLNVWTHLIGALTFITLFIYICSTSFHVHLPYSGDLHGNCLPGIAVVEGGHHTSQYIIAERLLKYGYEDYEQRESDYQGSFTGLLSHRIGQALPALETMHGYLDENYHLTETLHVGAVQEYVTSLRKIVGDIKNEVNAELDAVSRTYHASPARLAEMKERLTTGANKVVTYVKDSGHYVDEKAKYLIGELEHLAEALTHLPFEPSMFNSPEVPMSLASAVPRWPVAVFILSAVVCLFCSATFHLLYARGKEAYFFLSRLDYAGISVLIAGSFYPICYYGMYCIPFWSFVYLGLATFLAFCTFMISLMPQFASAKWLVFRTLCFVGLGMFGLIPFTHMIATYGFRSAEITQILGYVLAMGALYLTGVVVYVFRIPECFFPGKFDIWLSSHQIWHLFVLSAALVHFVGSVEQYRWRMGNSCPQRINDTFAPSGL